MLLFTIFSVFLISDAFSFQIMSSCTSCELCWFTMAPVLTPAIMLHTLRTVRCSKMHSIAEVIPSTLGPGVLHSEIYINPVPNS